MIGKHGAIPLFSERSRVKKPRMAKMQNQRNRQQEGAIEQTLSERNNMLNQNQRLRNARSRSQNINLRECYNHPAHSINAANELRQMYQKHLEQTELEQQVEIDLDLIIEAEREAYEAATVQVPFNRQEEKVKQILKRAKHSSLGEIKKGIVMARKQRMRTVEQYLCDDCDTIIVKPTDGFVIQGNIYVADPSTRGGLIGNNFPEVKDGEAISLDSVKQTVLCASCFLKALGLEPNPQPKPITRGRLTEMSSAISSFVRGRDSGYNGGLHPNYSVRNV
jgi:uncharacterized protein YlaI